MYRLYIAGAGDLGWRVAIRFAQRDRCAANTIVCETRTAARHAEFVAQGFSARLASDAPTRGDRLLIAFPPGPTYRNDVARALASWTRRGPAVLVSTIGVHIENAGGTVDESSPVDENSPILEAEELARAAGAAVVRLAGLYDAERGPQVYWQSRGEVAAAPDGVINLLHRDDAAEACAILLEGAAEQQLYLVSDGHPVTRAEIVAAWSARTGLAPPRFALPAAGQPSGKRVDPGRFQHAAGWVPRFASFVDFARTKT